RIRASAAGVASEIGLSREAVNNWRNGDALPGRKHRDRVLACARYLRLTEVETNRLLRAAEFEPEFPAEAEPPAESVPTEAVPAAPRPAAGARSDAGRGAAALRCRLRAASAAALQPVGRTRRLLRCAGRTVRAGRGGFRFRVRVGAGAAAVGAASAVRAGQP